MIYFLPLPFKIIMGNRMKSTSFGGGINLNSFIYDICLTGGGVLKDRSEMVYFNSQLLKDFNPEISSYSLCFMVPPPFLALEQSGKYDQSYIDNFKKLTLFSSIDFNPPQRQIQSEKFSARSGGIPYATEMDISQQASVSYLDNTDLDIFNFHSVWFEFVHELLLGYIPVPDIYLQPDSLSYGALDYAGSLFVIKYDMSMNEIKYFGKATGIYPSTLPNKEILGQRNSNELVVLPITYSCAWFDETLHHNHPIWAELEDLLSEYFI
jgi:hypothetical protein